MYAPVNSQGHNHRPCTLSASEVEMGEGERTEKHQTQLCEAQCIEKDSALHKTGANLSYLL